MMTHFLPILFFLAGFIGVLIGYFDSSARFTFPTPVYPYPFIAGIVFIATGGIIWALVDLKLSMDQQKKDRQ